MGIGRYKVLLLITCLSALIYANSFGNGFVYDDRAVVLENQHIRSLGNIPAFFTHPEYLTSEMHRGHYRPMVVVSYAINYALGGLRPAGYRIGNLLFHIGTAYLLFLTIEAILGSGAGSSIASVAALVFAVHPFNSEAVNYITARSSVMSGFFYLLSLYFWVKLRDTEKDGMKMAHLRPYMASLIAFTLSLLTKESAITLPLSLFLYDVYFKFRGSIRRHQYSALYLVTYLPFLTVAALYMFVRRMLCNSVIPDFQRDLPSQIYTIIPVLAKYIKLLFLPLGLNIGHYAPIYQDPFHLQVILSSLLLILLIINAVYLSMAGKKEWRLLSFYIPWFFVTLLPVVIIPLNRVMQENRAYIAGIGFALFLGILFYRLAGEGIRLKMAYVLLIMLIALYSAGTFYRNPVWKNGVTLWSDAMENSPGDPLVYNNLGVAYRLNGDYNQAKEIFAKGIRLAPRLALLHYGLAYVYQKGGDLDNALIEYHIARRLKPGEAQVYYRIGETLLLKGEVRDAMENLLRAIELKPDSAMAHYDLAIAYKRIGDVGASKREIERAIYYATLSGDKDLLERIEGEAKGGKREDGSWKG